MTEEVKVSYSIVGRYMNGKEVTGYQIQSTKGESKRVTREQLCLLVGRGDITNCTGQVYKKKVILKGKGININDLPIVDEKNSKVKNTDKIGAIKKGTSNTDAVNQLMIVRKLVSGGKPVGYVLRNAGGAERKIKRDEVVTLAKNGGIGNARVQMYKGKPLLRGVGINLNALPSEEMQTKAKTQATTPAKTQTPAKKPAEKKEVTKKKEPTTEEIQAKKLKEAAKSLKEKVNKITGVKVVDEDLLTHCLGSLKLQIGKDKKDAMIDIKVSDKVEYRASWWKDGNTAGVIAVPTTNPSAIVTKLVAVAKKEPTPEELQAKKIKEEAKSLNERVNKIQGVKVVDVDLLTHCLGSLKLQIGKDKKDAIVEIKIDMKGKVEYMASWWKDGNTSGIIVSPTSNSSAIVTKLVAVAKKEEHKSANAKAAELLGVNKKKETAKKTTTKKAPAKKAEPAKTEQPSVLDMFDELNPEEIEEKATKKAPAKKAASKAPAKKTAKKK